MPYPITETELAKTEAKIGIRFPESFRTAMIAENGGSVFTKKHEWDLYPFFDTSDRKRLSRTSNDIIRETEQARKWQGFPSDGWAIANNGFGDLMFFKRSAADLKKFEDIVYEYCHETGTITALAKDFSALSKK